jgi:hypothetical protein
MVFWEERRNASNSWFSASSDWRSDLFSEEVVDRSSCNCLIS